MTQPPDQPTLTDGTVTLRPWRDADIPQAVAGHDEQIAQWSGHDAPADESARQRRVEELRELWRDGRRAAAFVIEHDGEPVGHVELWREGETGRLTWALFSGHRGRGYATRAVRIVADWALTESGQGGLGLHRVEARVDPRNHGALRVATRAGLHREGIQRLVPGMGDRSDATGWVVLARLSTDPPINEPESFRALLNSFLPRKRGISQLLVRDHDNRVLLCQLTYKRDWDLPGGVVEVGESPRAAVTREIHEELGITVEAGRLLLTDWLPPWGGWDDALCLVFDGGVHDPAILDGMVREPREIRTAEFCTPDQVAERCADFTARRVAAALANVHGGGPAYVESGRHTDGG